VERQARQQGLRPGAFLAALIERALTGQKEGDDGND
jgi:hypothetical protein